MNNFIMNGLMRKGALQPVVFALFTESSYKLRKFFAFGVSAIRHYLWKQTIVRGIIFG
jgi:hypothetical protein